MDLALLSAVCKRLTLWTSSAVNHIVEVDVLLRAWECCCWGACRSTQVIAPWLQMAYQRVWWLHMTANQSAKSGVMRPAGDRNLCFLKPGNSLISFIRFDNKLWPSTHAFSYESFASGNITPPEPPRSCSSIRFPLIIQFEIQWHNSAQSRVKTHYTARNYLYSRASPSYIGKCWLLYLR